MQITYIIYRNNVYNLRKFRIFLHTEKVDFQYLVYGNIYEFIILFFYVYYTFFKRIISVYFPYTDYL